MDIAVTWSTQSAYEATKVWCVNSFDMIPPFMSEVGLTWGRTVSWLNGRNVKTEGTHGRRSKYRNEKKTLTALQCEYGTFVNFSSNLPHGGIWRSRSQLSAKESLSQIFSFYLTTGNLRVKCTWSTDCTWNNVFFTFNSFDMFRKVPRYDINKLNKTLVQELFRTDTT